MCNKSKCKCGSTFRTTNTKNLTTGECAICGADWPEEQAVQKAVTNESVLNLIKAALAALEQNATYKADLGYAKRCLSEAIEQAAQKADSLDTEEPCPGCGWPDHHLGRRCPSG